MTFFVKETREKLASSSARGSYDKTRNSPVENRTARETVVDKWEELDIKKVIYLWDNTRKWRRTRFAGKPDRLRFVPRDFLAWSRCWRLCHPREHEIEREENGKGTVAVEHQIAIHPPEDEGQLQDPRALVFPAEIKASVAVPLLKVTIVQ